MQSTISCPKTNKIVQEGKLFNKIAHTLATKQIAIKTVAGVLGKSNLHNDTTEDKSMKTRLFD